MKSETGNVLRHIWGDDESTPKLPGISVSKGITFFSLKSTVLDKAKKKLNGRHRVNLLFNDLSAEQPKLQKKHKGGTNA